MGTYEALTYPETRHKSGKQRINRDTCGYESGFLLQLGTSNTAKGVGSNLNKAHIIGFCSGITEAEISTPYNQNGCYSSGKFT